MMLMVAVYILLNFFLISEKYVVHEYIYTIFKAHTQHIHIRTFNLFLIVLWYIEVNYIGILFFIISGSNIEQI